MGRFRSLSSGLATAALSAVAVGCSSSPTSAEDTRLGPLGELLGVNEHVEIPCLTAPVDLVRDHHGRIHVYARSSTDAACAEGYAMARDRAVQLEILRRTAEGRLAELFGADSALVESDLVFRHLGLGRAAEAELATLGAEPRAVLSAFAVGVTQLYRQLRDGERSLPSALGDLPAAAFSDWSAQDSLAVGRLQAWLGSYAGEDELERQQLLLDLKATFASTDPDAAVARRAGLGRDVIRFEPVEDALTVPPGAPPASGAHARIEPARRPDPTRLARLLGNARGYRRASDRVRQWLAPTGELGSNAWAIAPELSATGHAMLASDPHGALNAPASLWPVAVHVIHDLAQPTSADIDVSGVAFPGVPAVLVGHNAHVAWGAVATRFDVTDLYAETVSADGQAVAFQGAEVPFETHDELIEVAGGASITTTVYVVPHHGPVLPTIVDGQTLPPDPASGAISVRWTGLEPDGDLGALLELARSADVTEAAAALAGYRIGGQSFMLADDIGVIAWTSPGSMPERDPRALAWSPSTSEGLLPCLVLPGDGTAEWTGRWPADALPSARDPLGGYLAAANNDPVGGSIDGDPSNDFRADGGSAYLGCVFDPGFRQARIGRLIEGRAGLLGPAELAAMQSDVRSPVGALLVPQLLLAIHNAHQEHGNPGSHPALASVVGDPSYDDAALAVVAAALTVWGDESDYLAAAGIDPVSAEPLSLDLPEARAAQATLFFDAWLVRVLALTFGDELSRIGLERGSSVELRALLHLMTADPPNLATYDPVTQDSALWDDLATSSFREGRQDRMVRAMLEALARLKPQLGADLSTYRWGAAHTTTLAALAPGHASASLPRADDPLFPGGFPRHGDQHVVDLSPFPLEHAAEGLNLTSGAGPVQRLVVDLDPAGPRARFTLAGGAVEDPADPHFADEAEGWRRNELHDVPFLLGDVVAAAETRMVAVPPR